MTPMKAATLLRTISFDGFRADEVYPADINGDGRLELLALQSPGIYQSDVFDDTRWRLPEDEKRIHCLTAIDGHGRVLWQRGTPFLRSLRYGSHVADQMVCVVDGLVAVLQRDQLALLDAATGRPLRETRLDHDNYGIVIPWRTAAGVRFVVKNTEAPYPDYWYGDPTHIYDADLRAVVTLSRTVGSGHSARTFDVDGDGADELLIGYEVYSANGRLRWRMAGEDEAFYDPILHHDDQIQIGRIEGWLRVVYAGSTFLYMGTLDGRLSWMSGLGHPQHVLIGNFRGGGKTASLAVLNLQVGPALKRFAAETGCSLPTTDYANGIVWLRSDGEIVNVVYPPSAGPKWLHSGEGILIYPQGCPDGSDAVIVRDCGWPRAYDLAGQEVFAMSCPNPRADGNDHDPVGPDGYGARIADFDGDGRAEILIHDRTAAWIFKPPYPAAGEPHTHAKLKPVTGQGWYAV